MGTLFGFVVGYIIGARAGGEDFDEVVDAVRAIRSSDEFQAFVEVVRSHVKGTAATIGRWLSEAETRGTEEALVRARERADRN